MRFKKRFVASLDQVKISRNGEVAVVTYADPEIGDTHIRFGPEVRGMSDQQILDRHNEILEIQDELRRTTEYVAREIPFGKPQIEYSPLSGQWVPRGDVLRCLVTCDDEGGAVVDIDGRELSMEEFGGLLLTHEGWGMRIAFVPEDDVDEEPAIEVSEPKS
jgi:hypothetical protein